MKRLVVIFIILCISSTGCDNNTNTTKHHQNSNYLKKIVKTEIPNDKETSEKLPNWLKKLYPDSTTIDFNWVVYQQIILFKQLNDSTSYCIFEKKDGVSSIVSLVSFINENIFQSVEIGINADHDQSIANYSWSEYKILRNDKIKTIEYSEFAPDSLLDENGEIREGEIYDDYELEYDTVITNHTILDNGMIKSNSKKIILGTWVLDNNAQHADIKITKESYFIVDSDSNGNMPYTFQDDTLLVQFPDIKYFGFVEKVNNDSLVINWNNNERVVYFKWTN